MSRFGSGEKSSVLNIINLGCILEIQIALSNRQLDS